jgi:uncharacterized membrane protein YfcA
MEYTLLIAIGIMIGIFSGLLGIGGAIILIPILVYGFGYTQVQATGTSLVALLLPVGALGVWQYYKSGLIQNQNIKVGLIVAVGMFAGTFIGARILPLIPADVLKKAFAIFLVLVAIKMWRS